MFATDKLRLTETHVLPGLHVAFINVDVTVIINNNILKIILKTSRTFNMTSQRVSMLTLASRLIASSGLLYRSDRRAQLHHSVSGSGCS